MELEEKLKVTKKALAIACKLIHDNLPSGMNLINNPDYLRAILGTRNDPEGKLWQFAFLHQALHEKGES